MELRKRPDLEPFAGYRLLTPLGSGGFGEVWKCEAPGGFFKAIKFVYSHLDEPSLKGDAAREELRAIQHLKKIRHPFLLSIERVELIDDELVIVMELADQSLEEVLIMHQSGGRQGIPRKELLRYLREAAEVLDIMQLEHGLQHLDVKPRNLFLVRDHVKVADFGLVQNLSKPAPLPAEHVRDETGCAVSTSSLTRGPAALIGLSPLYASPELFQGIVTPFCDQYSLAIVHQELLTGTLPFNGHTVQDLMLQHALEKPALSSLPESDRSVLERALAKNPERRFPTCTEMVAALETTGTVSIRMPKPIPDPVPPAASGIGGVATPPWIRLRHGRLLPTHELLTCLQRGPRIETWEARAADGKLCHVQFLHGVGSTRSERDGIALLQRLHHVVLAPREVHPGDADTLVIVRERIEHSLYARYQECLGDGLRGIPRNELLSYLETVAGALDQIAAQWQLHHLELSPRNVLLQGGRPKVADFGLAQLFWLPQGHRNGRAPTRYGAPELERGRISSTCDQYSLAMIYEEMLTGHHAFRGRFAKAPSCSVPCVNAKDTSRRNGRKEPNLAPLCVEDRSILARALHQDPAKRFGNCRTLIDALKNAGPDTTKTIEPTRTTVRSVNGSLSDPSLQSGLDRVADLVAAMRIRASAAKQAVSGPEPVLVDDDCIEARLIAEMPTTGALLKLDGFQQQWGTELVDAQQDAVVLHVRHLEKPRRPWRRRNRGLRVEISWGGAVTRTTTSPEVAVKIRALRKRHSDRAQLQEIGPEIVASLQAHLKGLQEKRDDDRVLWPYAVRVTFLLNDRPIGESIECQGKDLSPTGIGLYVTSHVRTSQVLVRLSNDALLQPIALPGSVIRVQRCSDELFEVGVRFDAS